MKQTAALLIFFAFWATLARADHCGALVQEYNNLIDQLKSYSARKTEMCSPEERRASRDEIQITRRLVSLVEQAHACGHVRGAPSVATARVRLALLEDIEKDETSTCVDFARRDAELARLEEKIRSMGNSPNVPHRLSDCLTPVQDIEKAAGYRDRKWRNECEVRLHYVLRECDPPSFGGSCKESSPYTVGAKELSFLHSGYKGSQLIRVCAGTRCEPVSPGR